MTYFNSIGDQYKLSKISKPQSKTMFYWLFNYLHKNKIIKVKKPKATNDQKLTLNL